jgi:hypothetical protein
MADRTLTLRVSDARALADRLFSRGISRLGTNRENERADLRTARLLWWLLRDLAVGEVIELPVEVED